jgi:hypothetical protein
LALSVLEAARAAPEDQPMPYSLTTDPKGRIRLALSGIIARADFEGMFADLKQIETTAEVTPDRITDITEVVNMETGYAVMLPNTRERSSMKFRNKFRSAIVASTPVQFGLARMFMSLNTNPQIELSIFKSVEAALAWLDQTKPPVL